MLALGCGEEACVLRLLCKGGVERCAAGAGGAFAEEVGPEEEQAVRVHCTGKCELDL